MLTLGTGVGGGIVIGGRIFRGADGLGAELGHVVVEADGPDVPRRLPEPRLPRGALLRDGARARAAGRTQRRARSSEAAGARRRRVSAARRHA